MDTNAIMSFIDRFGIATALLACFIIGGRQVAIWLAVKVVEPLANKHIAFMDSTQVTQLIQAEAARQTAHTLNALQEQQQQNTGKITDIHEVILRLNCIGNSPSSGARNPL